MLKVKLHLEQERECNIYLCHETGAMRGILCQFGVKNVHCTGCSSVYNQIILGDNNHTDQGNMR